MTAVRLIYFLFFISLIEAFEDKDLGCPTREHINGFIRRIIGKNKDINHHCAQFSPKLAQDAACHLGIAFRCNGNFESCDDPSAWIGGFQMIDLGDKTEIYVPYCCTSSEVNVRNTNCRQTTLSGLPNANVNFNIGPGRLLYRFSCEYSKALIGNKLNGMKMAAEDCPYNVDRRKKS